MNDEFWPGNYFNYFTEVEEHFQKARGTGLFLVSPLDWALIECWKEAGVPLERCCAVSTRPSRNGAAASPSFARSTRWLTAPRR